MMETAGIDVFVKLNGYIHQLEIKKAASPNSKEVKKYEFLDIVEYLNSKESYLNIATVILY